MCIVEEIILLAVAHRALFRMNGTVSGLGIWYLPLFHPNSIVWQDYAMYLPSDKLKRETDILQNHTMDSGALQNMGALGKCIMHGIMKLRN